MCSAAFEWNRFGDSIWEGVISSDSPEIVKNAIWEDLYHEEDFRAIADQFLAEDLGLPTI